MPNVNNNNAAKLSERIMGISLILIIFQTLPTMDDDVCRTLGGDEVRFG
jgi:hypothetical protein